MQILVGRTENFGGGKVVSGWEGGGELYPHKETLPTITALLVVLYIVHFRMGLWPIRWGLMLYRLGL